MEQTTSVVATDDRTETDEKLGRVGGWLMALSPVGYGILVASMAAIFASTVGMGSFDEITRTQMDALGGSWLAARVLVAAATLVVIVGAALVAWTLRHTEPSAAGLARASLVLAAVNAIATIADVALGAAVMGFTTATLGEDPLSRLSSALLPWTFGAVILQLLLLCAVLWVSRVRPITGLAMGVLSFVVLVVTVFAADSVPPFVVALLACPIGISWLRGRRKDAPLS